MSEELRDWFVQRAKFDYRIDWLNSAIQPRSDRTMRDASVRARIIDVEHGEYFRAGDVVRVMATGEALRVTGATNYSLMVDRSVGATTAFPIKAGSDLVIMGN